MSDVKEGRPRSLYAKLEAFVFGILPRNRLKWSILGILDPNSENFEILTGLCWKARTRKRRLVDVRWKFFSQASETAAIRRILMNQHVCKAKRAPGQAKCLWCGRWLRTPSDCIDPLTKLALASFAKQHGRLWKQELRKCWESSDYPAGTLHPEILQLS